MGNRYKKREKFSSKIFNFFATLIAAYFIGAQVIGAAGYNLKFAQISDVHYAKGEPNSSYKMLENSGELLSDAVMQVNAADGVDFVMFSGDMLDIPKRSQLMEFISIVKNLNVPWYVAFGNHDVDFDGKFTKSEFLKIVGAHNLSFTETKPYYAFKPKKGFKVIVLDTMITSRVTANGEVPLEQLEWLDNEVKNTSNNDVIIIFQHVPALEPYPNEQHKLLNDTEVLKHLYSYNRPLILFSGHYHGTKVVQDGNLLFVNSPALISYPNAFRIVNVNSQKDKVIVDLYYKETNLKEIQTRSRLRVIFPGMFEGEGKDRAGTYELKK